MTNEIDVTIQLPTSSVCNSAPEFSVVHPSRFEMFMVRVLSSAKFVDAGS